MIRGFIMTGLMSLVLATSASAKTSIILEARGFGSVVDPGVLPDPFILDVIINSDQPLVGCVVRIDGVGTALAMTQSVYGHWWNYDTDGVPLMNNDAGWSTAAGDVTGCWATPIALPLDGRATDKGLAQISTIFGSTGQASSGLVAWIKLSGAMLVQEITVTSDSCVGGTVSNPDPDITFGKLVIDGIPEPASASLLLLGVLFVRRRQDRRSARSRIQLKIE